MPCTTILAGRRATFDGSTFMARNEDSPAGVFTAKKFIVVSPEEQPRHYKSVLSSFETDLPDDPVRYTAVPNALPDQGIWGEAGVNAWNVAMSETETITSNPRVLGADPLVPGGIGEEDMLTLVLPYIKTAREGVLRLGKLLEAFGTYEMNGVGFQDADEVWWLESVGGHHWIAKRVPDDCYVVMPNQQGIDFLDLADALGPGKDHLCSPDLLSFIKENHLDLTIRAEGEELSRDTAFDARAAFGSRDDADHTYNTPRAWIMERYLNPRTFAWDGPDADFGPEADDLPWCLKPERLLTVEDVKYVLSSHFQGTPYDPYGRYGDGSLRGKYRPIGINRNNFLSLTQIRPCMPAGAAALQWMAMGSNVFNAFVPFYANVGSVPEYLGNTGSLVTTDSFYWANRLAGALADAHFPECSAHVERYQNSVHAKACAWLKETDARVLNGDDAPASAASLPLSPSALLEKANLEIAAAVKKETDDLLGKVLFEASLKMKNAFARSDA